MLPPKGSTFNGRPTFANPMYLKKAQSEKPCMYEIPYDTSDLANRFVPDREETLSLKKESRSKLNKDLVKPCDYTKQNKLVDQAWEKHSHDHFCAPTAHDMEILIKTCLMPLALKTQNDSFKFVHELKQEMHADLKYVESLEKDIHELESDKAEFSNMYDLLLKECVSNDFDKPSVVRHPNALRIPKQSVLGKPTPFSDSLKRKSFKMTKSVTKTNVLEGLSKPVTTQILPQTTRQAVRNTNVIKPRMYQINTRLTQTRAPQLPQTSRNTNPRVSTSIRVIHRTSVSRLHLRSTQMKDKVVPNNSQVKVKKTEVEDHHRISSISNKTKSLTACNDRLKSRTSNVNVVCATCGKCVFNSNHDACVSKFLNDVNARTKKPKIVQLILFIVDYGCTKYMTSNLKLLCNFVEKYLGTVHFGNDQFDPILGYEDLVQVNLMINRFYYVEGLNHNLFLVGQFCDADLEVAFRKSTCFVRDIQGNNLLTGNRGSDIYTISLQETTSSTSICFMAKASPTQAWLWHRRLSHLNFDYINLLSKKDIVIGKRSSFKTKVVPSSKGRLNLIHMDLCGPMRVESINGKKYILVIVDDYSRYTWTLFLRSKDETPEVLKDFLKMIQRNLQAQVISVRSDRGTEFLNKTLHAYFKEEGIEH
ncbi:retrovirus-related pol polyprotein from transposon TNT 1-94 [Tanacetum coccineum]|uniref:Retrovirus-related pol polyprotein from transposon TNT 1-94 n=1 Tax=Tanacetum coccineum TaxID=301880 RepID=A0ABQ4Z857_9ASTR